MSEPNWRVTGRHRRSPEQVRRDRLAKLRVTVLILATLAIGAAMLPLKPRVGDNQGEFVRTGVLGKPVDARAFRVTVLDVTGGATIDANPPIETTGVWVVVRIRVVAVKDPVAVGYAAIRDERGRVFQDAGKVDQPLIGGRTIQPGIPIEALVVFEVARDVRRLTARFAKPAYFQYLDAVAEIPLPITKADIDRWVAEKTKVTLTKPKVVG
jgi:hypothetical protein